jgi:hypothetical protein
MTDCPFIPPTADRLLQQHRPNLLVCRGPESCEDGTKQLFPGLKPDQNLGQHQGSTAFTSNTIASAATTEPADNALSP